MPQTGGNVDASAQVDPSAHIDESAHIGPDVRIGANAVVGPGCRIGAGTTLMHHAVIVAHTTMGERNTVHPFAVLGSDPQDRSFRPEEPGQLEIGDENVFREFVTIGRGNWNGAATRVGSGCFLMNQAHIGHNARIGDNVTMANSASLAGHSSLGDNSVMSAFTTIHQFVEVGRGVMFQATAGVSMHVPPFVLLAGANTVAGLNSVGLKRNPQISDEDRAQVKSMYRRFYRERGNESLESVCTEFEGQDLGWAAREFVDAVRRAISHEPPRNKGLCGSRSRAGRGKSRSASAD